LQRFSVAAPCGIAEERERLLDRRPLSVLRGLCLLSTLLSTRPRPAQSNILGVSATPG
jgi:hypothetical protein